MAQKYGFPKFLTMCRSRHIAYSANFGGGKLWRISHQKLLASKTLANSCLFTSSYMYMSRDIVKIWMVKFGKPPVINQIHQGLPPPKSCTIWYKKPLTVI